MAQQKNRRSPSKSGARGKSGSAAKKQRKPIRREVGAFVCLFLSIFTVLGCFQIDAAFLNLIASLFKGLFGAGFYILPFAFLMSFLILLLHDGRPVTLRVVCTFLIVLTIGALVQLVGGQDGADWSASMLPELWTGGIEGTAGGVIAGLLAQTLELIFSRIGAVIVLLDVTEKEENERLRREFTANVSHELKTPLTSISGYAEIMKDGLVKSADVPRFANNIYTEAQRLITLVEDILKLSKLDENAVELGRADTDLYAIAQEVACRLKIPAQQNSIVISVQGSSAFVTGVPYILDEMLYNLADNAVKYNRPGGRVVISTGTEGGHAYMQVSDTGIGIPAADRERVFERFYRVDKSRSKQIGGTGLGLSIVKHGAMFHHARVSLESEPNKGTTVRVTF